MFDLKSLKENKVLGKKQNQKTPSFYSVSWSRDLLSVLISCLCKLQISSQQIQFLLLSGKLEWWLVFGNIYSSHFTILGFYIKLQKSLDLLGFLLVFFSFFCWVFFESLHHSKLMFWNVWNAWLCHCTIIKLALNEMPMKKGSIGQSVNDVLKKYLLAY